MNRTLAAIAFYFLPPVLLSSVGILILVFQRAAFDIVFGILVLIFSVTALTGGIIVQQVVGAQVRRARLQTDFVAKVSHELRTPLASIRMFVDTLQSGSANDEAEMNMCLDVISTETSRLTSMIERLLSWGRMEAGRRLYDMRPELVTTIVGEALAQLETQLQSSSTTVDLQVGDRSSAVMADRAAMVEAVLNLLSNAIKYGRKGGVVTVRTRQSARRVTIDVEDDGPGIPRDEQLKVFDKFYRGATQLAAQTKGSGLGLAMARLVVRAHKGRIRLASNPGEGARFTIDLPALRSAASPLEVPPG